MDRGNENSFTQNISSNAAGQQNYYDGHGHQIITGSGTINNFNGADPSIGTITTYIIGSSFIHLTMVTNSDNAREKIMQALYKSPYKERKNRNPDRVSGTCEWFMSHDDFHHWRDSSSSSMLLVSANPGCGKSVLAKYLVDELKTTEIRTTCYFFFKDDFEDQRSAKSALSCILHQLFTQKESILSAEIVKRLRSYPAPLANSYYEPWLLWDILIMAAQERDAGEIVCILDAFDECANQERQDLTKILREFYGPNGNTKTSVNLKFLITSRPYDRIRQDLIRPFNIQDCPVIHLKGEGDAEVNKIAAEISLYIKDKVSHIRETLYLTPKEEDILLQGLESIPNQTYLWVYLTLEWIETEINNKINEAEIRNAISTLPRTVDEAYDKILARSIDVEETKKLLHIVVAAERPLTLAEMELALALQQHHKSYEDLTPRPSDRVRKYIRDLCGLFINITDEKIYLLHQTAKEFLVPGDNLDSQEYDLAQQKQVFQRNHLDNLTWKFSLIPSESHRILCEICIWCLLFRQVKNLRNFRTTDITKFLRDNLFLEYSAKNWTVHFRASNILENEILEQLQQLCEVPLSNCQNWFKVYWADIHTKPPERFTKLMIASYFGIETVVRQQIETSHHEIDAYEALYRRTALSFASERGFDRVVRLLIKGPKVYGKKVSKSASLSSRKKGADVNKTDKDKRTALFYAVWNGHLSIVKDLLGAGAHANMVDTIGGTPISYALCYGEKDIVTELMKGAQPHSVDEIRRQLLLSAMERGHEPVVKRLLDSGADPRVNGGESSLLGLAIQQKNIGIIKLLIEKGADINNGGRFGKSPLILAIDRGETNVIELLIEKGADINERSFNNETPLTSAVKTADTNIVKLLIEKGADISKSGWNSQTPLMSALHRGEISIIELLLENGADINESDRGGRTPLYFAIAGFGRKSDPRPVEMLLKAGVKVDYTCKVSNLHTYALQVIIFHT